MIKNKIKFSDYGRCNGGAKEVGAEAGRKGQSVF